MYESYSGGQPTVKKRRILSKHARASKSLHLHDVKTLSGSNAVRAILSLNYPCALIHIQ